MKPRKKTWFTYFIQSSVSEYIKIGKSDNPYSRMYDLQCANHDELVMLTYVHESVLSEADAHNRFAKYRHRGEWFYPHQELLDFIKQHPLEDYE